MTPSHDLGDNVCLESLSIDLTRPMLDAASRSVTKLADKIDEFVPFSQSLVFYIHTDH